MSKILKVLLVIMLTLVLLTAGCVGNSEVTESETPESEAPDSEASEEEVTIAPDFQLDTLDGQTIRLSDLRGSVVLLNFWAYWCSPCASEMPFIEQVHEEWQEKGLVVISVHVGESAEAAADFVEEYNLSFPVLMDIDGAVSTQYGVSTIPRTFLIDENGIIQVMMVGAFSSVEMIENGLSLFITE